MRRDSCIGIESRDAEANSSAFQFGVCDCDAAYSGGTPGFLATACSAVDPPSFDRALDLAVANVLKYRELVKER